ncbi:MAG: hypothetical protein WB661_12085, partial [Candidatus Bathyarchaeia archaeon]
TITRKMQLLWQREYGKLGSVALEMQSGLRSLLGVLRPFEGIQAYCFEFRCNDWVSSRSPERAFV